MVDETRRDGAVSRLLHPVVQVGDIDRSLAFYVDGLGLRVVHRGPIDAAFYEQLSGIPDPDLEAVLLRTPGGGDLELLRFNRPEGAIGAPRPWTESGLRSLTFAVADLPVTLERLSGIGVRPPRPPVVTDGPAGAMTVAWVLDPDGTAVFLAKLPPR